MAEQQRYWFMVYRRTTAGYQSEHVFNAVSRGEHPLVKVARWNREHSEHRHWLLWYRELDADEMEQIEAAGMELDNIDW